MAEVPLPEWSDKHLFIRISGRIYVIPSSQLEDFRNKKFESLKGDRVDEIFDQARETGDAAMLNVIVIAESDIIEPPYRKPSSAKKAPSTGASKRPRGTKK
jgi:hypothetical protein